MARKADPTCRTRIVKEAEHLLHLRGYHATSLEDIATACRMTKANILHHFRSKEDLCLAVLDYKIECTRCSCLDPFSKGDVARCVRKLFQDAACFHRNNGCKAGCFIGNIALEMSDINEKFRTRVETFFEEWTKVLEQGLRRERAAGTLANTLKPRATAESVIALYEGATMMARTRRDPGVFDRTGKEAVRLVEIHKTPAPLQKRTPEVHHGS